MRAEADSNSKKRKLVHAVWDPCHDPCHQGQGGRGGVWREKGLTAEERSGD